MCKIFSIIVTYNGAAWIEKCLDNLLRSDVESEVIIIDNASSDNTLELLNAFQKIHLIKNKKNIGFGQANNLGIQVAIKNGADFIFLLNQDVYVFKNTISQLVEGLKKNSDFGLLSPLQLEVSAQEIEPIFKNFLQRNYSDEMINNIFSAVDNLDTHKAYEMRFVNAAAWMLTRECILKTGLFHPVFFHYGEDNHYASRVQFHQMKIGVLAAARVIHDCKKEVANSYSLLIRKMKNIPLYTLLDLRKPFPVAYLVGFLKWRRLCKKLMKYQNAEVENIIKEQKKWFTSNLQKAKEIRKETKNVSLKL